MSLDIVRYDDGALTISVNGRTQRYSREQAEELTRRLAMPFIAEHLSKLTGIEW